MTLSSCSAGAAALRSRFIAVAGGVTGRDHRNALRDGQDGFALVATADVTAVIVTDGCSSGARSEVGARLGAAWLAELVSRRFAPAELVSRRFADAAPTEAARDVTRALVRRLRVLARSIARCDDRGRGAIDPRTVGDLLLFGFLAAVVSSTHAIVFGVGDGIVWVDGRTTSIDPGPANAPAYAAYALLGATIEPRIHHLGAARDVGAIAVATDGADELVGPDSDPSLATLVGDDRLLANPSLLRKRLVVLSDRGRFRDDATIGILRRAP